MGLRPFQLVVQKPWKKDGCGAAFPLECRAASRRACGWDSRTRKTEQRRPRTTNVAPKNAGASRRPSEEAKFAAVKEANETAKYPDASFSPIASPRRARPTGSIFMITVVDQQKPWFMPRSTLAKTTQPQEAANPIRNGTGRPNSQPATSNRLRPTPRPAPPANSLSAACPTPHLRTIHVDAA